MVTILKLVRYIGGLIFVYYEKILFEKIVIDDYYSILLALCFVVFVSFDLCYCCQYFCWSLKSIYLKTLAPAAMSRT